MKTQCSVKRNYLSRIVEFLRCEFWTWVEFLIIYAPEDKIGKHLREAYWKKFYRIGVNPFIRRGAVLTSPKTLEIGDYFVLGENAALDVGPCSGVYIGNHVGLARGTFLRSANHRFDDIGTPWMLQGHDHRTVFYRDREYSIVIEDDVWVGAHSVILTGTKLGAGCVVGAGSVVSGEFPPYSIILGNPARVVSSRRNHVLTQG